MITIIFWLSLRHAITDYITMMTLPLRFRCQRRRRQLIFAASWPFASAAAAAESPPCQVYASRYFRAVFRCRFRCFHYFLFFLLLLFAFR
jgi:hypothetical protein